MRKLLQIVIPTYNRTIQLQKTIQSISALFQNGDEERFCVDIFDNSDKEIQKLNQSIIPKYINHHKNLRNLGYAENVKLCLNSNKAKYIWLISDDDELIIENIIKLLGRLEILDDKVCGVSLSYEVPNIYKREYNLVSCLVQKDFKISKFNLSLDYNKVPFDFISGFIIKSDILQRIDVLNLKQENVYMQSLIYCTALEPDDLITFYEDPVIRWEGDDSLPWPFIKLFEDRETIRNILIRRHNFKLNNHLLIRNLLKWALLSKIGFIKNTTIEEDKFVLFFKINTSFNLFNLVLSILLILPNKIIKKCIIIGFSLFGNKNNLSGFAEKYKSNNKKLRSKL